MSSKRKHCSLTISDKVKVLKKLDQGTPVKNVCDEYGIGKSTIYDLKKQRSEILKVFSESDVPENMAKRKTLHSSKCPDVDKVLMEWIRQRRMENVPLDRNMIVHQAKIFHEELEIATPCEYSSGWYNKFRIRHGLRLVKASGEKSSADVEAAESYVDDFQEFIDKENLTPEQVYNADESSLFWRYIPRKTYILNDEKSASGYKDSKERLTIMTCANAAGTHKCKLLVIGKSRHPRALNGVKVLPVHYMANQRAWMTAEIFEEWFKKHFVPEARNHCRSVGLPEQCKIALILDNCSAHTTADIHSKENVLIEFLPPNCTSVIQPMDQGVIRSLKCSYKTEFMRKMLDACNSGLGVTAFQKDFNVKDALWRAASAWHSVSKETLSHAWHKLWPSLIFLENDDTADKNNDFRGFSVSAEKLMIDELLEYAKEATNGKMQLLDEEAITDCLNIDKDGPIVNELTNREICDMVLHPEMAENASDDEEEEIEENIDEIPIDKCIDLTKELIRGLETKSFINEAQIMQLYKLQEMLQREKPKKMKQLKISDIFMKADH